MFWLNICQGILAFGLFLRLVTGIYHAAAGREALKPTGALGIFLVIMFWALFVVINVRAGALSTVVGYP